MAKKYHSSSWWLLRTALALLLAFTVGLAASCSDPNNNTAAPSTENPPVTTPDKPLTASPDDNGADTGTDTDPGNGNGGTPAPTPTKSPTEPANPPTKPVDHNSGGSKEPVVVAENEAFRIFAPADDAVVGTTFKVTGEARVFEAAFSYSFEDGHNVLAEGHVMADQGAPEWGKFEFEVTFKDPTSPYGILIIYENSAKDGSPIHQLEIRVQFKDGIVKPVAEGA
ncbi:hypothetical protein PCCS19_34210 [Paenibacillus sp. CCS19]|uniref:Gmad2 immunoglobulin-like domain-containing protein n=1 Tax=Paenibacillus sp. CCS19 TaxID=3158387 RepID=UPI00256723BE|nr:Gmad2 immunoglobulin-like domain-containing protein [Paenibacillus cellulosilyticus]GMK40365.1 hypothetical protein PCCS19_34210 [Paenibacillus cellulosilyticus]